MSLAKTPALIALVLALLTGALPWRYCTGHGEEGVGGWMFGFAACRSADSSGCARHQHAVQHEGCCGSQESSDSEPQNDEEPCCCDSDLSVTTGTTFEVIALDAPALSGFLTVLVELDLSCTNEIAADSPVERRGDPGESSVVLLC